MPFPQIPCLLYLLRSRFAATERARRKVWESAPATAYGPSFPDHTTVALLGLVFCCVSPLVLLPCLAYFLLRAVAETHQVRAPRFQYSRAPFRCH